MSIILEKKLITSKNNTINIISNNPFCINYFNDPVNYTEAILKEINNDKIYAHLLLNKKDMIIFDIGAHIGLFSLYASDSAKKIYAFEPDSIHFNILKELTYNFTNTNTIIPVNMAISVNKEDSIFYMNNINTTMHSLVNQYSEQTIVKCIDLYSFIQNNKLDIVDLIKCDIEGGEIIIFTKEEIKKIKNIVKHLYIKVHNTPGRNINENIDFLKKNFKSEGYNVHLYRNNGLLCFK
jgi:FkbM family methyltransferase